MLNRAIRLVRKIHDMTLVEVAKDAGISVSYLAEIEKLPSKKPSLRALGKIAGVYGLSAGDMLRLGEAMEHRGERLVRHIINEALLDAMIREEKL